MLLSEARPRPFRTNKLDRMNGGKYSDFTAVDSEKGFVTGRDAENAIMKQTHDEDRNMLRNNDDVNYMLGRNLKTSTILYTKGREILIDTVKRWNEQYGEKHFLKVDVNKDYKNVDILMELYFTIDADRVDKIREGSVDYGNEGSLYAGSSIFTELHDDAKVSYYPKITIEVADRASNLALVTLQITTIWSSDVANKLSNMSIDARVNWLEDIVSYIEGQIDESVIYARTSKVIGALARAVEGI